MSPKPRKQTLNRQSILIGSDADIAEAGIAARALAAGAGFTGVDLATIACAVSEIARNIVEHARVGEVVLSVIHYGSKRGLHVVGLDRGPGIAYASRAIEAQYSTAEGVSLGSRMMDASAVESKVGMGTRVTMSKWLS